MIRLLAFLGFKRAILRYAFEYQVKPRGLEGTSQKFIDSEGRRYYAYDDDNQIPIKRLSAIQEAHMELSRSLTANELSMFLDAMDTALNDIVKPQGKKITGLPRLGHILGEMRLRNDQLIHEEILFKLAAILYIREDEDPAIVDMDVLEQKIKQFRKDAAGGLHDFFYQDGLRRYMPFANMSKAEWEEHLKISTQRIMATNEIVKEYLSEPQL